LALPVVFENDIRPLAGIDDNARRFWPDIKLVTVPQTSDADTGVDANALDLLGHGSLPPEIAIIRKEHWNHQ
jgi:hypothetical protein